MDWKLMKVDSIFEGVLVSKCGITFGSTIETEKSYPRFANLYILLYISYCNSCLKNTVPGARLASMDASAGYLVRGSLN